MDELVFEFYSIGDKMELYSDVSTVAWIHFSIIHCK